MFEHSLGTGEYHWLHRSTRPILYRGSKALNVVCEKKKFKELEIELNEKARKHAEKLWGKEKAMLAELYFGAANLLAINYDKKHFVQNEKELLQKTIVKACELSFTVRKPSPLYWALYMKWSQQNKPVVQPLDGHQVSDFFSMLMDKKIDFTTDKSRRGKNLLAEQMKEAFGFMPMSEVMGIKPEDKPKEIVELYKRLTEHCINTLELDEQSGVKRSDTIRELDSVVIKKS